MRMYGKGLGKPRIKKHYATVGSNIKQRITRTKKRVGKSGSGKKTPNFGFSFGG